METTDTVIAVFADPPAAETAVKKKLATSGFDMKKLSVAGKGYNTDEKVVGFYNVGDRIKFWGKRGAFWAGLWGCSSAGCSRPFPLWGISLCLGILPPSRSPLSRVPSWLVG
jgi:hypothetical protein